MAPSHFIVLKSLSPVKERQKACGAACPRAPHGDVPAALARDAKRKGPVAQAAENPNALLIGIHPLRPVDVHRKQAPQ